MRSCKEELRLAAETDGKRVFVLLIQKRAIEPCADIHLDETQVQDLDKKYDVVMANIIDGVLVRLQNELKARVKPGGWLILSGIIGEREPDFLGGFKMDKKWDMRRQKGDWILYAVKL